MNLHLLLLARRQVHDNGTLHVVVRSGDRESRRWRGVERGGEGAREAEGVVGEGEGTSTEERCCGVAEEGGGGGGRHGLWRACGEVGGVQDSGVWYAEFRSWELCWGWGLGCWSVCEKEQ